jgi:hypothetical protein
MLDIEWRSVMVAAVFLIDLIVFADLARAEFGSLQRKFARRPAPPAASLGAERAHGATERKRS